MPEDIDYGNPNVFYIFQGKYEIELEDTCTMDNQYVMLTKMCTIEFMGDAVLTGYEGGTFARLPEECWPSNNVRIPILADDTHTILYISSEGELSIAVTQDVNTVHLNGVCINNCGKWY